jgi:hypothetical protein
MNEENGPRGVDRDRAGGTAPGRPSSDVGGGRDVPDKAALPPSANPGDSMETTGAGAENGRANGADPDRPIEPSFPDLITDLQRTLQVLEMSPDALEQHEQAQIRAQINAPLPPALAHKVEIYQTSALVESLDEMLNSALEFGRGITRGDRYRNRDFAIYIFYIPASAIGPGFKAILDMSPTELILEALEFLEWRLYGVFQFTHIADQHLVEFITYMN